MRILFIIYDDEAYIPDFPIGIAYLAKALVLKGYEVEIYNQDIWHYPDEALTEYLDKNRFDVVGIGLVGGYYQYKKLKRLSNAINKSKQRPFYILGGHGPSPEPEFFLKRMNADAIVIGEGELTIIELLEFIANRAPLSAVKGIAFREGDKVFVNERRPTIKHIDSIPFPAYELFPMHVYRLLRLAGAKRTDFCFPILSCRGCKFRCNFCYRLDPGFRPRSSDSIIEEIKLLLKDYGITYIGFYDELLMSSVERTIELCEGLIKARLNIKWECNGRLNYAKPEVLELMKKSGCVFINYGIEAFDDTVLRNMNKRLTTAQIIKGIEATLAAGVSPGLNIIFGNFGDNRETLNKAVDFLLKYDDGIQLRTIRPVTPYPGSPLYYDAISMGLLRDCEDFYENKHINSDLLSVNFTDLSDEEFYDCLLDANKRLLKNYFDRRHYMSVKQLENLYLMMDESFRGFRHV